MPSEYAPGMTQDQAMNQVDPSKDDKTCQEMQAGYKFCGDLKKKLSEFAKAIQSRAELLAKKKKDTPEGEKFEELPVVSEKIKAQIDELKAFIAEGAKNPHVDDMSEFLNEFWAKVDSLGTEVDKVKKEFNLCNTNTTRAVFKVQNATMAKLKARKKELAALNKENKD